MVLVVEDSPTQAIQLRCLLEEHGFQVISAASGEEGLEILRSCAPLCVITDIVMPGMSGYELCAAIKQDEALEDIPVMVATTLSDPEDIVRGLHAGADYYVTKPYDERYLIDAINTLLSTPLREDPASEQNELRVVLQDGTCVFHADRRQMFNLLMSTYGNAILQNEKLMAVQRDLQALNGHLEEKVEARTAALRAQIEERRRAQQEKESMQSQFLQSQKMEAIGRLAGGIAHDFNNLLTTIVGYSDLLMMSVPADDQTWADIEQIRIAGKRASDLTRQILAFSRRQVLEPQVVNLQDIIANMVKMLQRLIGEDVELVTTLDSDLAPVYVDSGQIEQVIMNLAVNARDAMPSGGKVVIRARNIVLENELCDGHPRTRPATHVHVSVEDTGCGMDQETIASIFEPFFTTKDTGTGLGLSVVYGIVEQHEGWITVHSEPGRGSTFNVYLPASDVRDTHGSLRAAELIDLHGNGEHILLVEDDEPVRRFATRALTGHGYRVTEALCGIEAVELFDKEEGTFDLLFTDVVLPDATGPELVDQLLSRKPELRVLLTSGYADTKSQRSLICDRGFNFIQKPYPLTNLLQSVRQAVQQVKNPESGSTK